MSKSMPTTAPKKITVPAAQSFTFRYNAREDRLVMALNYTSNTARLDLMITRAMVLKLIPVIEKIAIEHHLSISPQRIEPQKNVTSTISKTDTDMLEVMGKTPQLLEKIDFQTLKDGRIVLLFFANGAPVAQAVLTPENFAQIMQVMLQSIPHHSWGIAANILQM